MHRIFRGCSLFFFVHLTIAVLVGESSTARPALAGHTVHYPGTPLAYDPWGFNESLFPGDSLSGNTVDVDDGDITNNVYGGVCSDGSNVTGNRVGISGNAHVHGDVHGGISDSGAVYNNSVGISGGTTDGYVFGGHNDVGAVYDNSVDISGGAVVGYVYGGSSDYGPVYNNRVRISGGTTGGSVHGGFSGLDDVHSNSVYISGNANVQGDIYGGVAIPGSAYNNSVTISGGTPAYGVYGGWSYTGNAVNNTVTISGAPNLSASTLYGGFSNSGDAFTGNTLNIYGFQGTLAGTQSFQRYNFVLPAHMQSGGTLLTVADPVDMAGTTVTVNTPGGSAPLAVGSSVTVIDGTVTNIPGTATGLHGATLTYNWTLTENSLEATLNSVQASPRAKALSEGRLTGLIVTNQGGDLIAGTGMSAARNGGDGKNKSNDNAGSSGGNTGAATQAVGKAGSLTPFAVLGGGRSRYDTGSHADVDSLNTLAGLAWNTQPGNSDYLMLGVFFEAGAGDYSTNNSFSTAAGIRGNGNTNYYGGGILGRYDADYGGYAEASARMGLVETDFAGNDLRDAMGINAGGYDTSSLYYGAHAGLGYIWSFSEQADLDLYGKYFWTHQNGDKITLNTGDPIHFDGADSQRLRGGARFSHSFFKKTVTATPYIGIAYEHEFNGKARASTYGYSIDAPELKGGTGIGEIGISLKPVTNSGFGVDLGMQGYTGMREGVSGSLQMRFDF